MNSAFFRGLSLPYAETHYKFKLPWSPLYRRWPEIFVDGPSFCVPGVRPVFYLVVKDGDLFPVRIREVQALIQDGSGTRTRTLPLDFAPGENLVFHPLPLDLDGLTGEVSLNFRIRAERSPGGAQRTFLNANFPGITPSPLRIAFLSAGLPYPEGWHAGELHCHSDYSNDPVEYGAPLRVLQEAGTALGMGYVVCTDHSYDFYYDRRRYMQPIDPEANFAEYRRAALDLNAAHPEATVVIPGEEVSCGNHLGENVHLLVAGHPGFLPGLGDGGRRWLNNKPDLPIGEVLERARGTPCFSAHPRSRIGGLERFVFRRGMWHEPDLRPAGYSRGVDGLQFWNGHRGRDFSEGRAFWVSRLLAGERISPIGANDAHGDLNRCIGVKTPLFSLYQNRNHVYGHVRTVVHAPERTVAGIQAGLAAGRLCCTDGPFLDLERAGGSGLVVAHSIPDYGPLARVAVWSGRRGESRESLVRSWSWDAQGPMEVRETLSLPADSLYVRAEAATSEKRFALSAPAYP
jgi:hypothetical protein